VAKKLETRNKVLIVFSLIFYAWGEPVWIILKVSAKKPVYLNIKRRSISTDIAVAINIQGANRIFSHLLCMGRAYLDNSSLIQCGVQLDISKEEVYRQI